MVSRLDSCGRIKAEKAFIVFESSMEPQNTKIAGIRG
jgi:hypothetical protein